MVAKKTNKKKLVKSSAKKSQKGNESKVNHSETMGTIGFVLSIMGLIFTGLLWIFGMFFAVPGLILCLIQRKRKSNSLSLAGIIVSSLAIAYFVFQTFWFILSIPFRII